MTNVELLLKDAADFDLWHHSIFLAERGSRALGLHTEESDIDIIGVYMLPKDYILGLKNHDHTIIQKDKYDILLYSITKYIHLLIKGNPNLIETLFYPAELFYKSDWVYDIICTNKNLFITKSIFSNYLGYANGMLNKMPKEGESYHTKDAMHLIRLLMQSRDLLELGTILYPSRGHNFLREMKEGKISMPILIRVAEELFAEVKSLLKQSTLPENVNFDLINKLLVDIHQEFFGIRSMTAKLKTH